MIRGRWSDKQVLLGEDPSDWGPKVPMNTEGLGERICAWCGYVSNVWNFYPPHKVSMFGGRDMRTRIICNGCYERTEEEHRERMAEYYSMIL
jgi:hypothetical protein